MEQSAGCAWVLVLGSRCKKKGAEVREPQTAQKHALKWDKMCVSIRATRGNAHVEESQNAVAFVESQVSSGRRASHFSHPMCNKKQHILLGVIGESIHVDSLHRPCMPHSF